MAPHSVEPEQAEMAAGRMPASSNARATPTSATHAPPPPDATTPIRLSRSPAAGRDLSGGNRSVAVAGVWRSMIGSGRSASRALSRKDMSPASERMPFTKPIRRLTLNGSRASSAIGAGRLRPRRVLPDRSAMAVRERAGVQPAPAGPRLTAHETLARELREHALVIGEFTLTSGQKAHYLIDAKRAILRPA